LVQQFIDMYRPHAAREDTVLFPAVHRVMGPKAYDKLGDRLEDKERELFGKDGFEQYVGKVAALEREMGINDLARFTPGNGKGGSQ
jgi:hemerythrin-like domain-containing protein